MKHRYVGFGEEAAHGTPVAAVVWVDDESTSLDPPEDSVLIWQGSSGQARQVAAGGYQTDGDIALLLDDVVSGWWWKWLLGHYATVGTAVGGGLSSTLTAGAAAGDTTITVDSAMNGTANDYVQVGTGDTAEVHQIQALDGLDITLGSPLRFAHAGGEAVTEVTAPYTHTFTDSGQATLHPFTTRIGKDLFEHVFAGCVLGEVEITVEDSFVTASLNVLASRDSKGALPASVTYSEGNVFASHHVTAQINAVDESARVEQLKLTAGNGASLGRGVGSRHPNRGYRGAVAVEGELTLAFTDLQELERFWGDAGGPAATISEFPITINIGDNIDLVLPRVVYTKSGQPKEGPDRIMQTVGFTGLEEISGEGALQVVLVTDQPRYGA